MWKYGVLLLCLSGYCVAGPVGVLKRNIPIGQQRANDDAASSLEPNSDEMMIMSTLNLPSNATSIRADITDNFSCENKRYGYYADIDNDCQIFHVCLPVTYADGKENTFRWSFICPEETVFSQDSFTCMRPGDMIISCEESIKYYDLNSNFGNVEEESEKEMNEMPALEANKPSWEVEPEEEAIEPEEPVEPMPQPVKVQKPNRRKPGLSYAVQKKPSNSYPLRKIPQPQLQLNANANVQTLKVKETVEPVEEDKKEAVEEEIKPVIQKFSRRPVPSTSNNFKDKMQNSKPEIVNAIRSDMFNQKRKRPTMFNKKPIEEETEKANIEPAIEKLSPALAENSEQTLPEITPEMLNANTAKKVEAEPAEEESPTPVQDPEQTFFQMEPDMSNANIETQATDAENQASETNEILVKPQEVPSPQVVEEPVNAGEPQVLEAIEEIPAVIAEVEEPAAQSTNEKTQQVEEIPKEQPQTAEEPQAAEEIATAAENQASQALNSVQESQTAVEADKIEENIQLAEEPQAVEAAKTAGEAQNLPESQAVEQIAEDNQMSQQTDVAEEIPTIQETEDVNKEVQIVEEPEAVEKATTSEDNQTSIETQAGEEEQVNAEDTKSVIASEMPEETDVSQEAQVAEANESQAAEESLANEMVPAAEPVQSAEELPATPPEQPIVVHEDMKQEETAETTIAEETEHIKSEMVAEPEQEASVFAEPSIFEENSEETAAVVPAQTIEEMEDEKPAEAPESMPATEEMAQQDPIVQQMFEETNDEDRKQTIGGFKPVDPVMAAEAEQLIADFINTLRKNEFVNEKPGMPMQMPTIEEAVQEFSEDTSAAGEESAKVEEETANETQGQAEEVKEEQSDEIPTQPQIVEAQVPADESNAEELEDAKPSQEEAKSDEVSTSEEVSKTEEMSDIKEANVESSKEEEQLTQEPAMIMSNVPQDIYRVPVHVIINPLEEMPQQESENQPEAVIMPMKMLSNTEEKLEAEAPAMVMDGYKPLSIDDIVELVKERLDHMPKDEMEAPMQLEQVLSEVRPNAEQASEDVSQAEDEQAQETQQPEEEIVMPIYHRTAEVGQVDAPVQHESAVAVDNTADLIIPQEKSSRFFRSRSLLSPNVDSRKRRFLFRSDAS